MHIPVRFPELSSLIGSQLLASAMLACGQEETLQRWGQMLCQHHQQEILRMLSQIGKFKVSSRLAKRWCLYHDFKVGR